MTTSDRTSPPDASPALQRASEPGPGAVPRAARPDVRNPMLRLASVQKLLDLPQESQDALREVFLEIRSDSRNLAEKCWVKHKAPMAVYWRALSVYAGHLSRCLRRPTKDAIPSLTEPTPRPKLPSI